MLRVDRVALLAAPEAPVGADHVAAFDEIVARRATGEPVAYIRGIKEFYGLALSADPRALIPRPETELLVELGLDRLRMLLTEGLRPPGAGPVRVWDVGTGSGAIAVALAAEARRRGYSDDVRFQATDVSTDAFSLATENAVAHGVADMIDFATADLTEWPDSHPVNILLANLPYVPTAAIPQLPVAASFEPALALDGGVDGLDLVRRLIGQLDQALVPGGTALLEIGSNQADHVRDAAAAALPGWDVTIHEDLAGLARVVELQRVAAE